MKPPFIVIIAFMTFAVVVPGSVPRTADAEQATILRIATLAPSGSSWMQVFNAWNHSLEQATNGTLKLRFYEGGSQGDEHDFVRKMGVGQLDGAAITAIGLGILVRPVLVLALPGVITTYPELTKVQKAMSSNFDTMFKSAGYHLLGWSDIGKTRLFSKEKIEIPSDLKKTRPWRWTDDLIFGEILKVVGVTGNSLGVPEVYPALQTGLVDTVAASALAAVSLQWYTRLSYVSAQNSSITLGATILKKDKFDALTPAQQKALTETGIRAHQILSSKVASDDQRAYDGLLARGITEVDNSAHKAAWDKVYAQVRTNLIGRVYPKSLLNQIMALVGKPGQ